MKDRLSHLPSAPIALSTFLGHKAYRMDCWKRYDSKVVLYQSFLQLCAWEHSRVIFWLEMDWAHASVWWVPTLLASILQNRPISFVVSELWVDYPQKKGWRAGKDLLWDWTSLCSQQQHKYSAFWVARQASYSVKFVQNERNRRPSLMSRPVLGPRSRWLGGRKKPLNFSWLWRSIKNWEFKQK